MKGRRGSLRMMGRPPRITEPGVANVNRPMDEEALKVVWQSAGRGVPLGTAPWKTRIANHLGLDITLHP